MLYWLYTEGLSILRMAAIPLSIAAIVMLYVAAKAMGPAISLGEPTKGPPRGSRQRMIALIVANIAAVTIYYSLTPTIALKKMSGRPGTMAGWMVEFTGGPPNIDKSNLFRIGLGALVACLAVTMIVSQAVKPGGWLREAMDRWGAPRTKRGALGSAHFCTPREFRRFRKKDQEGVTFYGNFFNESKTAIDGGLGMMHLSLEDASRGIITIGGPGSGKTQGVILPVIADSMRRNHSLIVVDPQGELKIEVIKYAKATGHLVIIHDPTSTDGPRFNISEGIESVADATAIAQVLIKSGGSDSFWEQSAQMLLAGCLLRFPNLGEITNALVSPKKLAEKLAERDDDAAKIANSFIASASGADGKLAGSVIATLSTSLEGWADATVRKNTETSDFTIEDFVNQPTVIVLTCPGRKRAVYARYLGATLRRLMLDLDTIGEQNRHPTKKARLPAPVNIIMDEFPTLGKLDSLVGDVNLVRKRGISILIGIQTLGQLNMIYGAPGANALLTGLATQIVYGGCDSETAEHYSRSAGTTTTDESKDPTKSNPRQRPLLTADEIIRPLRGNLTIFARYVEASFAVQAIMNARLTRIYEREDWAEMLDESKNKKPNILNRPMTELDSTDLGLSAMMGKAPKPKGADTDGSRPDDPLPTLPNPYTPITSSTATGTPKNASQAAKSPITSTQPQRPAQPRPPIIIQEAPPTPTITDLKKRPASISTMQRTGSVVLRDNPRTSNIADFSSNTDTSLKQAAIGRALGKINRRQSEYVANLAPATLSA